MFSTRHLPAFHVLDLTKVHLEYKLCDCYLCRTPLNYFFEGKRTGQGVVTGNGNGTSSKGLAPSNKYSKSRQKRDAAGTGWWAETNGEQLTKHRKR